MDIFSWKYPNERFRVLLWAMSLTKESEHLASHHLSVDAKQEIVTLLLTHSHKKKYHTNHKEKKRTIQQSVVCATEVSYSSLLCCPKKLLKIHRWAALCLHYDKHRHCGLFKPIEHPPSCSCKSSLEHQMSNPCPKTVTNKMSYLLLFKQHLL